MKKHIAFLLIPLAILPVLIPVVTPKPVQAQTTSGFCYTFAQNLGEGRPLNSANAQALTRVLSSAGLWDAATPITTYNDAVASAVSGFQEKYASQILTPNGLSFGTGYVGASTRADLNSLYGCSSSAATTSGSQMFQCPAGWTCTAPTQSPVTFSCPAGWICAPATTTENAPATSTTTNSPNSVSANLHLDVSSPSGQTSQTVAVPIMGFNILAQNGTLYLNSLTANIFTSGTGNVTNAYLYANGTKIATASVLDGIAQFNSISSIAVEPGTEQIYTLEVDTNNAADLAITAVIYPASVGVDDTLNPVTVVGGAYGNQITVIGTGTGAADNSGSSASTNNASGNSSVPTSAINVTSSGFGSPTWSPNPQPTGVGPGNESLNLNGDTAITWPITFTVTSGSSPIYISATPNSAVVLGSIDLTPTTSINAGQSIPGDTNAGSGASATGSFIVPANSNRTFTVVSTLDNSGNANPATGVLIQFNDVYYSFNPTPSGSITDTNLESVYPEGGVANQSRPVTLSGEVPITSFPGPESCDTSVTFCVSPAQSRTFSFNLSAGGNGPVTLQAVQSLTPDSQDVLLTSSESMPGDTSTTFLISPSAARAFTFTITSGVNPVTIANSQALQLQ